jgi:hypothetical protein
MDTVTITSRRNLSLNALKRLIGSRWPTKVGRDRLAVEGSSSCVYIYHPSLDNRSIDRKRLYLDYHSVKLVKEIVQIIGDDPDFLIDNDFGTALHGDQFVARLRLGKGWDWTNS